ncbi:hypothetical protein NL108_011657 [Boleophthalmus pectinirostris]|nr:hypothetical protein NL108_011657 [Boleophthalmus pectinirostris]
MHPLTFISSCDSCHVLSQRIVELEQRISVFESRLESDQNIVLGKTRATANSAQLADTEHYSGDAPEHQPSPPDPGVPTGTGDHYWLQRGARPKAPMSSTPVRSDPWTVLPRNRSGHRGKRANRQSCSSTSLANKFNVLDHEDFPPLPQTYKGQLHFTPAPPSDRPGARGMTMTVSPPALGNLQESESPLLPKSFPAAPVPPGGSAGGSASRTPVPTTRREGGGPAAPSLRARVPTASRAPRGASVPSSRMSSPSARRERGDGLAPDRAASWSSAHISAVPSAPASGPDPSVLVLGSSMVRHVRVNRGHTSCHPGALVKDIIDSAPTIIRHHPTVSTSYSYRN